MNILISPVPLPRSIPPSTTHLALTIRAVPIVLIRVLLSLMIHWLNGFTANYISRSHYLAFMRAPVSPVSKPRAFPSRAARNEDILACMVTWMSVVWLSPIQWNVRRTGLCRPAFVLSLHSADSQIHPPHTTRLELVPSKLSQTWFVMV